MPDAGLGDEGRVCSLLSRDGHLEGDNLEEEQQPHLLPIGFLPDPCALQSIHQVNLPPY